MTKIEIFADNDLRRLRNKVNDFIRDKNVVDVKITTFTYIEGDNLYAADRILVVYEDEPAIAADPSTMKPRTFDEIYGKTGDC